MTLDLVIATPEVDLSEARLIRKEAVWIFEDPAIEELAPIQKQVLRMGPENAKILKAKAAEARGLWLVSYQNRCNAYSASSVERSPSIIFIDEFLTHLCTEPAILHKPEPPSALTLTRVPVALNGCAAILFFINHSGFRLPIHF